MTTQQVDAIDTRRGTIELIMIRPSEAVIDRNVREHPDPDPELVNSISERGVLQPPTCWVDEDGMAHITIGQRRTLAAVLAGDDLMPAIAKPRAEAEAERIYEQLTENDRRAALPLGDRLTAYGQLTLFGIKADEIAKQTGTNRAQVRKAVKLLQEAPAVVDAIKEHPIDLEQAARIAEYSDHPDLVEQLTRAAAEKPEQLPHELAAAKKLAAERAAVQELREECEGKGWEFVGLEEWGDYLDRVGEEGLYPLDELKLEGDDEITPEQAHAQGGLVAIAIARRRYVDGVWQNEYLLDFYVLNPEQHGYSLWTDEPDEDDTEEPSPEELEIRRAAEAAMQERDRQRAAWSLAAEVRREWIRDVLLHDKRKLPKDAALVILEERLRTTTMLPPWRAAHDMKLAAELLGAQIAGLQWSTSHGEDPQRAEFLRLAAGLGPTRVSLAVALGRVEAQLSDVVNDNRAGYFELLESWGYGLSEIERMAIAQRDEKLAAAAEQAAGGAD